MSNEKKGVELPIELEDHLSRLRARFGDDVGGDLKDLVEAIAKRIDSAAKANPSAASSMFLARPTGYVE